MRIFFLAVLSGTLFLSSCEKDRDRVTLEFQNRNGKKEICVLFENGGSSGYQPLNVRVWAHPGVTVYQWKPKGRQPVLTALFEGSLHEAKVLYLYGMDRLPSGKKNLYIYYRDEHDQHNLDLFSAKGLIRIENPGTEDMTLFAATEDERKNFLEKIPSEHVFERAGR